MVNRYDNLYVKEGQMNQTLTAAFKEIARLLVFSLPGALILLFTENPELAGIWGVPALYILRAIDKALHESDKAKVNGLVPF